MPRFSGRPGLGFLIYMGEQCAEAGFTPVVGFDLVVSSKPNYIPKPPSRTNQPANKQSKNHLSKNNGNPKEPKKGKKKRKKQSNLPSQSTSTPAFLLAALTAGGGITGYVRTGSLPSVIAGVGVGTLVCTIHPHKPPSSLPHGTAQLAIPVALTQTQPVPPWRPPYRQ